MDLFVDDDNLCNSLTPCYSSIQTAVVNATPDSHIMVFPGTYVDNVDISQMGIALGPATDGNIKFSTVDSQGNPDTGASQVAPVTGLPFTHTGPTFNGNIEIVGFVIVAVDDDAIDFDLVNGDITIGHVDATSSSDDGIDLELAAGGHTIRIYQSHATGNGSRGFNLDGPDGTVVILDNNTVNNNTGEGVDIDSASITDSLTVTINNLTVNNNGDINNESAGLVVDTLGTLSINNLTTEDNTGPGLVLLAIEQSTITDATFTRNGTGNGYDGILFRAAGSLQVSRSVFTDNDNAGIGASDSISGQALSSFNVSCSQFSGGALGVELGTLMTAAASYTLNNLNFANHSGAALYAGVDNAMIDATNNYWDTANGPTHTLNAGGTGEVLADVNDDPIGGAQGTVMFSPFLTAPVGVEVFAPGTIFRNDFDGNPCTIN